MIRRGSTSVEHWSELLRRALKLQRERSTERSAAKTALNMVRGTKAAVPAARLLMEAEKAEWRALRRVSKEASMLLYTLENPR